MPVVGDAQAQTCASCVVEEAVLHRRTGQPVLDGVLVDVAVDLVAAVFELAVDVLGEVGLVVPVGEVLRSRTRFGTHDHHDVGVAGHDGGTGSR